MITISTSTTPRLGDTTICNVEHVETGNCLSYAFLEDEDRDSVRSPSNVRARLFAEAVLNGSNARYRNCDGALALRNLAEAVKEHPCVLRKGSEIEFAAGLFQE